MHQVIIESQEPDGIWVSSEVIPVGQPVRFTVSGLIPLDFNTVEFLVVDANGFDVLDTFSTSDGAGVASSSPRTFTPNSYALTILAKDMPGASTWHATGQKTFTVEDLFETEQPGPVSIQNPLFWPVVGAVTVVGLGLVFATRRKK